jgi:hypothetical protein
MINKRLISGVVAAFSLVLAFPALASAHTLSVSAGPSACVTPLNGSYTATVTITESYFGGTTENIPVGQNVHQLSSSTDKGNTGLNQNYFTQGAVGTQTGPVSFPGQPTSFTSPNNNTPATQTFKVTTSVPETYVLGNSYMGSPSSATITAPRSGCTPTCPTGYSLVNGVCTPPTGCPTGLTLSGGQCVPPTGCPSGQTLSGGVCMPPTTCPSGQVLSNGQCVPPTTCPSGEVLSGGHCEPPTTCPSGETLVGSVCGTPAAVPPPTVYPGVCRASTEGYKVRAGQVDTIIVSVARNGAAVTGTKVRITLPGGESVTKRTGKNGKATFTVEPTESGTIIVRSPSCKEMIKVKVYAAKAATAVRSPSFTG